MRGRLRLLPGLFQFTLKTILHRERGIGSEVRTEIKALGAYIKENVQPLESPVYPHNRVIISLSGNQMVAQRDDSQLERGR